MNANVTLLWLALALALLTVALAVWWGRHRIAYEYRAWQHRRYRRNLARRVLGLTFRQRVTDWLWLRRRMAELRREQAGR